MDDAAWHKIMHGLTTRRYSEVVRELEQAYGIFVEASRGRLEKVLARPLGEDAFCAVMIDGTCFEDQMAIVALA
jgi:putative transposase